ncbi:MAG: fatty acid desaturase [Verrucomicrobiae bacterium]|nr:fatty acid desaturase [Verrucomicrobiae bacterium]
MAPEKDIQWYRSPIDKNMMKELMRQSDAQGFRQVFLQLGLSVLTGTLAYLVAGQITAQTWMWSVPLFIVCLYVHGTFYAFFGGAGPIHELSHKTVFKTKAWNEFFLKLYSFLSYHNWVGFRTSHVKHHQVTIHSDLDGEVVLPFFLKAWHWITVFTFNPTAPWGTFKTLFSHARGIYISDWERKILGTANDATRAQHRHWAQFVLIGHALLATLFIVTGQWPLLLIVTLAPFYGAWLAHLCVYPQHVGMMENSDDFRLCCRTYTCGPLPAFLYWNMQYHVEHHMYPSVPFYNLPKLRKAIESDLPPATHGLWATWKEVLAIVELQKKDPSYYHVPPLPPRREVGTSAVTEEEILAR